MQSRRIVLLAALGLVVTAALARALAPEPVAPLTPAVRAAALAAITRALDEGYVFPDLRPALHARLAQAEKAGRYDMTDPLVFADRITEDLRDVSHDRHLSLVVDPRAYAASLAPRQSDAGLEAFLHRQAVRNHHGLAAMSVLPGNVRYLKITGFEWVQDETGAAYDDAMRFLKDGDAVIVDLRGNGGGSHSAVRYLVSHFLDPDTLLMTFLHGKEALAQSWVLDHLPAGRLKGKPLYVLIDGRVASAGEDFAYDVEQWKLGELIGAKTAGAANNNERQPIAPCFVLSVSVGRPLHPVSQGNWEGKGIEPTVAVPPEQALEVAQVRALDRLAQAPGATPEQRGEYAWARVAVEARLHPVSLPPEKLAALAGRYGDLTVELRDGALWLARPNRPTARLAPLTDGGLFALEGIDVVRVRLAADRLELQWQDEPAPRVYPRG
ncbi:MAG TPA: S41 family peptidase [Thermoanaerobaculia bacterium]